MCVIHVITIIQPKSFEKKTRLGKTRIGCTVTGDGVAIVQCELSRMNITIFPVTHKVDNRVFSILVLDLAKLDELD